MCGLGLALAGSAQAWAWLRLGWAQAQALVDKNCPSASSSHTSRYRLNFLSHGFWDWMPQPMDGYHHLVHHCLILIRAL